MAWEIDRPPDTLPILANGNYGLSLDDDTLGELCHLMGARLRQKLDELGRDQARTPSGRLPIAKAFTADRQSEKEQLEEIAAQLRTLCRERGFGLGSVTPTNPSEGR